MKIRERNAAVSSMVIGLTALLAGRVHADEDLVVERPRLLLVVEVDRESLKIDVPTAVRAIEASLRDALGNASPAVEMAAIDTPPRG